MQLARWSPPTLFGKLLLAFAALATAPLVLYSVLDSWFDYQEQRAAVAQIQRSSALVAAQGITQFIQEIQGQLAWATHIPLDGGTGEAHRIDALRVLRQSPAIIDLALVDGHGSERVAVSRVSLDRIDSRIDRGQERAFIEAQQNRVYYGPVTFRRETEPFMTLAVAGQRREFGVVIAEINLKLIRNVVSRIAVGREGRAWVADQGGRLVAHPDISLVLSNLDVSERMREVVRRTDAASERGAVAGSMAGLQGGRVLAAYAEVAPMGWTVVAELPEAEADEPLWQALYRSLWIAAGGLAASALLAVALARRIVRPIQTLTAGADELAKGRLDHRLEIDSGDEIEALGHQFNNMARRLQTSYADLESKVQARTEELAKANETKSRFLAAASHDLRQPLHALNLLMGQLEGEHDPVRREQVIARMARAVEYINGLFDGLLDISKLDAGVVAPQWAEVPLAPILQRVHATFLDSAEAKGLKLLLAPTRAWVRTDPQLLERVVQNLVSNAVRYTATGGVVLGCRWHSETVDLEVWDSGIGIPPDKQPQVFSEFVQLGAEHSLRSEGLGLGLAIVDRLCGLLGHRIGLRSAPGAGTRFIVTLQRVAPSAAPARTFPQPAVRDPLHGLLVLVVDDDELALQSAAGLLQSWGCVAVTAAAAHDAVEALQASGGRPPDLLISDFHLAGGEQAHDVIERVRAAYPGRDIPVLLMSGDVGSHTRERASELGLLLLDKPVRPMALRAAASRLVTQAGAVITDRASSPVE